MPLLAYSNEVPTPDTAPVIAPGSEDHFFQEFMNMLATLGLIVAALLFISWFLKRMVNSKIQQGNTSSLIKVIEQRALSPRSNLYVVEIQNKQIILGETPNAISLLGELPLD